MTSCMVEAINSLWSGLALGLVAAACGGWGARAILRIAADRKVVRSISDRNYVPPSEREGIEFPVTCCLLAMILSGYGSYHGQQSLRFVAASSHGYSCTFDAGNVVVHRGARK